MTDTENPEDRVLAALERVAILTSDLTDHLLRIEKERDDAVAALEGLPNTAVSAARNEEVAAGAVEWLVAVEARTPPVKTREMAGIVSYQGKRPIRVEVRTAGSAELAAGMVSNEPGDRVWVARMEDVWRFTRPFTPALEADR